MNEIVKARKKFGLAVTNYLYENMETALAGPTHVTKRNLHRIEGVLTATRLAGIISKENTKTLEQELETPIRQKLYQEEQKRKTQNAQNQIRL